MLKYLIIIITIITFISCDFKYLENPQFLNPADREIDIKEMVFVEGGTFVQTTALEFGGSGESFKHTISSFYIGKYEVTYELWYNVRLWGIENGYTFANAGREISDATNIMDGKTGAPPTNLKYNPVNYITWRDAVVWCNAYSEMEKLTPVYYTDSEYKKTLKISTNNTGYICIFRRKLYTCSD